MKIEKYKKTKVLDKNACCFLVTEIDFDLETKKVVNFCLVLLFHKDETIYEIIKYDGTHGICHVHKYYEKRFAKGETCLPSQINTKSIIYYKEDILKNYQIYLKQYKSKWKI